MAFMTAGDVKLADPLKDPLSGIGAQRQASLESILGRVKSRNQQGQAVSGRPMSDYAGPQLDRAGTLAGRGIDDALYGLIGGGSYKDLLASQEHARKMALAKKIGRSYAPSLMQEVMQGVNLAGQVIPAVATAGKSAYDYFNPSSGTPFYGAATNPYGNDLESLLGRIRGFDYSPSSASYMR